MNNRLWVLGAVVLTIGVVISGWFLGIQPKLAEASAADLQRLSAVELNATNQITLAQLKEQFETLDELEAELGKVQRAVPYRLDSPQMLADVSALAASTGVTVDSVVIGDPLPYGAPAPAVVESVPEGTEAPEDSGTTDGTEAESEEAAEPVAPAPGGPVSPPAVTDSRITASNFVAVPVTISVGGSYPAVQAFTKATQTAERLFLVTALALSPADSASTGPEAPYTAVLTCYVWVLLDPAAEETAAADIEEAGSGNAEPTPTETPAP